MGVNGIDNDPHAHPYARADLLGTTLHVERATAAARATCA